MALQMGQKTAVQRLALIGCGLIGGSFALALKAAGAVAEVTGSSGSPASAHKALELGAIDRVASSAAQAVQGADAVLLAVPVAATQAVLEEIAPHLAPQVLVMDAGSTKRDVLAAMQAALPQHLGYCVPAHPIAGKEKSGVAHAESALFKGRRVILTPLTQSSDDAIARAQQLWELTGARVSRMSPLQHDETFAAVSHLPHLLAFAYMAGLMDQPGGEALLAHAGSGFRDFTRIAASDPVMWRDILLANRGPVLAQAQAFGDALEHLAQTLRSGDGAALQAQIEAVSRRRSAWPAA
ncbi:prephenate dehydrogenase [Amphibiibacter pelophylacis]|uniref:Prephenate dehydrogenase/arogenate dehydrogenase family protein n=1 Tax=Amphibiibacter pelophylacis TaxID=1799477 RepID=A0ACC6P3G7_9BURK